MVDQRMQQFWQRLAGDADKRFPDGMDVRVLRQDALTKRWTLYIQNSRTGPKKPTQYKRTTLNNKDPRDDPGHVATCPFCKGMEALKTPISGPQLAMGLGWVLLTVAALLRPSRV